ncbi:hypothetical protein NPIL_501251 [Nephila pilipes]|uniref:Uncharacterized protein n=1 Tax=Nephila pilipes TaxID=299642 RepID=A0A8X6QF22_NEPPI|nr:hypothetical protein NPIL_501251 [Nephila pilipes]
MSTGQKNVEPMDIKLAFDKFTENAGEKGKLLMEDIKRWFESANIIGAKMGVTVSDFESILSKHKKEEGFTFTEFKAFVEAFAKEKKQEVSEFIEKLAKAGLSM